MAASDASQESVSRLWQNALRVCPSHVQRLVLSLDAQALLHIEEIRFRLGQPVELCGVGFDQFLHAQSGLTLRTADAYRTTAEDMERVVQAVTQSSLYAVEEELRRGFVTMPGGHRVGIAGRAVLSNSGTIRSIRSITSVNIRVAKEKIGAADSLRSVIADPLGAPYSVLFISPPQCGKTTMLRDLARQWSEGAVNGGVGRKVCVVDERSELAGCLSGVPQFHLGPRTDILDACPKAEGLLMAIRSLSPEVVVTDEIGRSTDADAILEAAHAGVSVIASAHARTLADWKRRPHMGELFEAKAFSRYVLLSRRRGPGTVEDVLDESGRPIAGWRAPFAGRRSHDDVRVNVEGAESP
ncbi:stage III sporulation protein AA [Alicyclobacillus sp. ALC3]|uniref:stage III sporulation protein AA n=1 Tax=Alicyclobacillus sp. ALC3 TaxID=2796143 RepID=UPI0023796606|nr:stage III sporulation protein AA [Alicyclobacillus sp. ALC3]